MIEQEADEASRLLLPPGRVAGSRPSAEADEALKASDCVLGRHGCVTSWPRPTRIAATTISRSNGSNERTSRRMLALVEISASHCSRVMADDPRFKAFLRKMKLPEWPTQAIAATGK